jgi:hypothetical protein
MAGDADLVARPELLAQLVGEGVDGAGGLWDVRGPVGAGKTVLLRQLERQKREHDVVTWVETQDLTPFDHGQAGAGVVVSPEDELRRISRVLASAAAGLWDSQQDADAGPAGKAELTQRFQSRLDRLIRERAEAALGRGDPQAAVVIADDGWQALPEADDDPEFGANFHRIHADAAWEGGDHGLALDLYARAALSGGCSRRPPSRPTSTS